MSTSVADPVAVRAWCDDLKLWVHLADGRVLGVPLSFFPRLMHATAEDRNNIEMSAEGRGLHWDHLNEDISIAGLLDGAMDRTLWAVEHQTECPECGASAGPSSIPD